MASDLAAPKPSRPNKTESMIQSLTDDLLRATPDSLHRDAPDYSPPHVQDLENPLRPLPLSFSPKPSPKDSPKPDSQPQWGDFSGAPQVRSPVGSVTSFRSRGTMRSRASVKVPRTMSRSSRPEPSREGRPLDSPMFSATTVSPERTQSMFSFDESQHPEKDFFQTRRAAADREPSLSVPDSAPSFASPDRSYSNASVNTIPRSVFRDFDGAHFSPIMDEVDEVPELGLAEAHPLPEEPEHESLPRQSLSREDEPPPQQEEHKDLPLEAHPDPDEPSAASLYKEIEAQMEVEEPETVSELPQMPQRVSRQTPSPFRRSRQWAEPPPQEGMVYYPAPVPMNLNLPKRLSQVPTNNIQAQRRSQLLASLPADARRSVQWFPPKAAGTDDASAIEDESVAHNVENKRRSNMKNLPPQLRASLFFDHPSVPQRVQLQRGSAVLTLESLLDESTTAPVTAFKSITDAHVAPDRRSTTSFFNEHRAESRLSRGSMPSLGVSDGRDQTGASDGRASRASMLSGRRSKSIDNLKDLGARPSSALSMNKRVRLVNRSQDDPTRVNFGDDFDEDEDQENDGAAQSLLPPSQEQHQADDDDAEEHFHVAGEPTPEDAGDEANDLDEEEDPEEGFGPPTTLLAELQLRKAKLRQRTRTAANAFPNGMHSTLLQMEAVAQIEKKKRQNARTALAWEDPPLAGSTMNDGDGDDDDVPLGMLFPERNGLANRAARRDPGRPVGLVEQRERENNETLGARRNRILGIQPAPPQPVQPEEPPEDDTSEHGDETLAQRTRRLRAAKALDDAIGGTRDGAHSRAISDDFASEMMSQFGGGAPKPESKPAAKNSPRATAPEEETLGQRRKRLQAEALARGNSGQQPLRQSSSLANALTGAPVAATGVRNVSGTSMPLSSLSGGSGLLGASEVRRTQSRQHIIDQNTRSGMGLGLGTTLVDMSGAARAVGPPQIFAPTSMRGGGGWGIPAQTFSHGFGAIQAPVPRQPPRGSMLWAAQEEQRVREQGRQASGQLAALNTHAAGAMGRAPVDDEQPMSPVQRENIDRWRQSIMM